MASRSSPGPSTSAQHQRGKKRRGRDGRGGEEDSLPGSHPVPPKKRTRRTRDTAEERPQARRIVPSPKERAAFYSVLEEEYIQEFLYSDCSLRISDKYLLAMVLVFYKRAGLKTESYRKYFFAALFLANQMEEDVDFWDEIYPWALGPDWDLRTHRLQKQKNMLLRHMGFDALVQRETCEMIMAEDPTFWAWTRTRQEHHSWAIRRYRRSRKELKVRGPWSSPLFCAMCGASTVDPKKWDVSGDIDD